ncbi:MAG: NAD(P)H-dependent oxidoreductase [Candidatus Eremiobacteraeota bacterium]|nr:NAD(P)H-dependent oxidoreductase [Candidatus Eremiobacteraeota bacterium]
MAYVSREGHKTQSTHLLVPVLYGSVREGRQGIKAARFVVAELQRRGCEPVLVDPLEVRLPLLEKVYGDYESGAAPEVLQKLADLYKRADGFAIVSGEYNHGVPPALKNLIDHFLEEYFWRPSAIISYSGGRFGGVRAAMQLRSTLGEIGTVSIPSTLPISNISTAFTDEGVPTDERFIERSDSFFREFVWYMEALKTKRASGVPY